MAKFVKILSIPFLFTLVLSFHARAEFLEPNVDDQAEQSVTRAVKWLLTQQNERGGWSNDKFPALTGFALWGLARSKRAESVPAIAKAVKFLKACQVAEGMHKGAIYRHIEGMKGGGLPNYNTAICISALAELDDPSVVPMILNGRQYLARSQHKATGSDLFSGGMGYDASSQRAYADLSNSFIAYDAMFRTARFEEQRTGAKPVGIDWDAALRFIQRCHNDPQFNKAKWVSADASEKGGFVYRPDEYRPSSGAYEKDGVVKFRSMPGMTYAGLLSYIYCGVDKDDPRVRATVNWISANWQLERSNRNPEMQGKPEEKEGLYYLYNVMSKGLHAYGKDVLTLADGTPLNWREEMLKKLIERQKDDGSWINENGRYWESDRVLVTSYALLAIETILGR